MSVNVANTAAGMSGKTAVLAEGSQTITGAKTFDLGASPPFVAVAGSAVVTHLDSDKCDGEHAADFHNATLLASGTVPAARLGSGTPTVETVLRGDNTWGDGGMNMIQIEALS